MRFPPFHHADFLMATVGAQHDLAGSAYVGPSWTERGLGPDVPVEVGAMNMDPHPDLRTALADHLGTTKERVFPTSGTSTANLIALIDALQKDCNVVCERPVYTPLHALAAGLGAEVRFVDRDPEDGWRLRPDDMADACDDSTAAIMLTSPNNPTGATADEKTLKQIGDAAAAHGAAVIADQIFCELGDAPRGASVHEAFLTTAGFNKCWGAPALRIGWVEGDPDTLDRLRTIHQYTVAAASPLGERLALDLLRTADAARAALRDRLAATHGVFDAWVEATDGVECGPASSLMAFPRVPVEDTLAFQQQAIKDGVRVLAGDHFGVPGHLRIGLGGDPDALAAGLDALAASW